MKDGIPVRLVVEVGADFLKLDTQLPFAPSVGMTIMTCEPNESAWWNQFTVEGVACFLGAISEVSVRVDYVPSDCSDEELISLLKKSGWTRF